MAIDPLRSTGGRIIQLHERPAAARRPAGPPVAPATPSAGSTAAGEASPESESAPGGMNLRKALVLARIQKDYYGQAHVRERVIDSLLHFLDEE